MNIHPSDGIHPSNEMDQYHKVLPTVKRVYVTLQDFTQDYQKIYTDISAVSVTLCNSGNMYFQTLFHNLHIYKILGNFVRAVTSGFQRPRDVEGGCHNTYQ